MIMITHDGTVIEHVLPSFIQCIEQRKKLFLFIVCYQ